MAVQLYDGIVTFIGVSRGIPEGNPVVRAAMAQIGEAGGLFTMKAIAVALLALLYSQRHHRWVAPGLAGLAIAYMVCAVLPWTVLLASLPR